MVYCAEQADNAPVDVHYAFLARPSFTVSDYNLTNTEGDGRSFRVKSLEVEGVQEAVVDADGRLALRDVRLRLIPYYAWNHRGVGKMEVWFANRLKGLRK